MSASPVFAPWCMPKFVQQLKELRIVRKFANQDQPLDRVDFVSLRTRLSQNGVQEKLTKLWIDRCLRQAELRPGLVSA